MREETFKLDDTPTPLVINDFMVTCWIVYNFVSDLRHLYSPALLEKVTKAAWAIRLNRGPDMLPMHNSRVVVVSDKRYVDKGVYWRGIEVLKDERIEACWEEYAEAKGLTLETLPQGYKGNRRDKDDGFYECHEIGWAYAQKYFPCFKQEGYEADDWAGALYREIRDGTNELLRERQKFLYTIDRDWSGLVDESRNIWWANTRYPGPRERIQERLAGEDQVILHTKIKLGYDINHPIEIFAAKAEAGELGDNLPPGAPIEYIDLTETHPKYVLEKCDKWESFLDSVTDPEPNIQWQHYEQSVEALKQIGVKCPRQWVG